MRGVHIPRDAWELERLPDHLTVTFRVVDEHGREVARGTDLDALRRELAPQVRAELAAAGTGIERTGLTTWSIGTLPRERRDPPGRARGHRVSRAGRPRRLRRRAGVPDRGRARSGHVARPPPAAADGDPVARAAGAARPRQRDQAGALAQPARLGGRAASTTASPPPPTRSSPRPAARRGTSAATPGCARCSPSGWPTTTLDVLHAVRAVLDGLAPGAGAAGRADRTGAAGRARRPHRPARRAGRAGLRHRGRARPGSVTSPATWRRRSGGSRSCASTRPATPPGRRRSGSSPTSTPPSSPPSRRASSRPPRCARSAG